MRDLAAFYQKHTSQDVESEVYRPLTLLPKNPPTGRNRRGRQRKDVPQRIDHDTQTTGIDQPQSQVMMPVDVEDASQPPRTIEDSRNRTSHGHIFEENFEETDHPTDRDLALEEMADVDDRITLEDLDSRVGLGEPLSSTVREPATEIQQTYERMDRERHALIYDDQTAATAEPPASPRMYPGTTDGVSVLPASRSSHEPSPRYTRSRLRRDLDDGRDVLHFFVD